jgi:hypothetical protein
MNDAADDVVLRFMQELDTKLDRVIGDLANLKIQVARVEKDLVALTRRVKVGDRIDRRYSLVEGPV